MRLKVGCFEFLAIKFYVLPLLEENHKRVVWFETVMLLFAWVLKAIGSCHDRCTVLWGCGLKDLLGIRNGQEYHDSAVGEFVPWNKFFAAEYLREMMAALGSRVHNIFYPRQVITAK